MKPAITVIFSALLLAGFHAAAQDQAAKKWDIGRIDVTKLPAAADKKDLTFDKDILPLFKASCVRCHGEQRPRKDLRLDSLSAVLEGGSDGKMVVPGESAKSLLLIAAARIDDRTAMPPKGGPRRGGGGQGGPGGPPPGGGPGNDAGGPPPGSPPPDGGAGGPPPGGPGGPPPGGGGGGRGGPPPKPLTADEVALVRAWIDQGAK